MASMTRWAYFFAMVMVVSVADAGWKTGRATYYGEDMTGKTDGFSIHHGSCGFGNLDPKIGTGWDIAAISDRHPDFQGSCGKCYELKCKPMIFKDNYGDVLDKRDGCQEDAKSVFVTIVDVCPCHFPKNLYSNKRWCCGDMDHFDLSVFAFKKLAKKDAGVIALDYREVPCPSYDAFMPEDPKNMHVNTMPDSDLSRSSDTQRVSRISVSDSKSTQYDVDVVNDPETRGEETETVIDVSSTSKSASSRSETSASSRVSSGIADGGSGVRITSKVTVTPVPASRSSTDFDTIVPPIEASQDEGTVSDQESVKGRRTEEESPAVPSVKPTVEPTAKPNPKPAQKPAKEGARAASAASESTATISVGDWTSTVSSSASSSSGQRVSRKSSKDTISTQASSSSASSSRGGTVLRTSLALLSIGLLQGEQLVN